MLNIKLLGLYVEESYFDVLNGEEEDKWLSDIGVYGMMYGRAGRVEGFIYSFSLEVILGGLGFK